MMQMVSMSPIERLILLCEERAKIARQDLRSQRNRHEVDGEQINTLNLIKTCVKERADVRPRVAIKKISSAWCI